METNVTSPMKPRLLALLTHSQAEQAAFIAQLTDAERAAIGEPDAWSAKDHIAHITSWKWHSVIILRAASRGEAVANSTNIDEINAQTFAEHRLRPWSEILADAEQKHADLVAAVEACTEEELTDPERFPWREGNPLWQSVTGNGYLHPVEEHYTTFYRKDRGDPARAEAIQQAALDTIRAIFGETEPYGYALYNLGCFQALQGQHDLAIVTMSASLRAAPSLIPWSREDPDLVSLRDDPTFQAIYTRQQ